MTPKGRKQLTFNCVPRHGSVQDKGVARIALLDILWPAFLCAYVNDDGDVFVCLKRRPANNVARTSWHS